MAAILNKISWWY